MRQHLASVNVSDDEWSMRANYWRGKRALGGHLKVADGKLTFSPHSAERALGGDTSYESDLTDVIELGSTGRTAKVPRRRLTVQTGDGRLAYFLVPKLDEQLHRLVVAIKAAGGNVRIRTEDSPQSSPDAIPSSENYGFLPHWLIGGWIHVILGTAIWGPLFVVALMGDGPWFALIFPGMFILLTIWNARRGFQRAARRRKTAKP